MNESYFIDIQEFNISTGDLTLVEYFRYELDFNHGPSTQLVINGISWGTLALVVI